MRTVVNMVVLVGLMLCWVSSSSGVPVSITGQGIVQGIMGTTHFKNRTIYKFMGIPYAEPPTGNRRFMQPMKKIPWTHVWDATTYGRECTQINRPSHPSLRNIFKNESLMREATTDSENCLFLDIYSPQINSSLPVLFYIHGGSFIEGASHNIKPEFLLEHDIVLVAPQYRLGPLGFLSLNTTMPTGNAAMYDLLMALTWVKDHIAQFGGDSRRITISGISAGAASAALLSISPLTQDLFSQVMLLSGSALAPWAIDPQPWKNSESIASLAGCIDPDHDVLLSCLKKKTDPLDIMKAYFKFMEKERAEGRLGMGGTTPVIDGNFLDMMPEVKLSRNNYRGRPMVMSTTHNEGIFLTESFLHSYANVIHLENNTYILKHKMGNILMGFAGIRDPTHTVAATIVETYFSPDVLGNLQEMIPGITDFNGAAYFKGPALKMAELNVKGNGTTYLTTFVYDPTGKGVNHAADQKYLFPLDLSTYSDKDFAIVRKLTKLYADFVIYGSPNGQSSNDIDGVNWSPYTQKNNAYLVIDESSQIRKDFEQEFAVTEMERKRKNSATSIHLAWDIVLLMLVALMSSQLRNH